MSRSGRRLERALKATERIVALEYLGRDQADTLRTALDLISSIQVSAGGSAGINWALARLSNSAGKLSRELGQPFSVGAAHHKRALRLARRINDPALALEAVLNIAHCYEEDVPFAADRALVAAGQIAASSLTNWPHDQEWARINIQLRQGQLFQMQDMNNEKTLLYQNIILPRMANAPRINSDSYAIGLFGFAEHMFNQGAYDRAWDILQSPAIGRVAADRTLIAYQVAVLRGRIFARTGQIPWAEQELVHANHLRLRNHLTPAISKKLADDIAGRIGYAT